MEALKRSGCLILVGFMPQELNDCVQELLDRLVASGEEIGLQVAAYVDGELVVDAWAGVTDEASRHAIDGNTLFTSWSTTKGFVATCLHILVDRGLVDYDTTVAMYWPEFSVSNKDKITVRHVLTHSAGIPHMPEGVTPEMMTDWDAMCSAIAKQELLWTPGEKTGYHFWVFGWIIGEIIRRVDGRPIAQFVQEEVCQPLGIEGFYLGIPDDVEHRVAPLREEHRPAEGASETDDLLQRVEPPRVTCAEVINRPDIRRASIPACGGIMTARAIARHYAMLAGHGELDGTRILSAARVDVIRALQTDDLDEVYGARIRRGLGYFLGGDVNLNWSMAMGRIGREFGHPGWGGSIGFADPEERLSFGLTKNLMKGDHNTALVVAEEIRKHLQ
ncbi:MAG: beta-lactamase family protein [Candidatus Thorarchaeota archaeon]|nr:MAG: beta-lactamase family protein [Candidatus Thorarchaeota archaeon]